VIEETAITRSGPLLHRLRAPEGVGLAEARAAVRARPSGASADFNHFYRSNQDIVPAASSGPLPDPAVPARCEHLNCLALDLVGWPALRPPTCQAAITVGVIDTGVNIEHPALPPGKVELVRLADPDLPESSATHGTSILSMLVGTEVRAPGLIPEAQIIAVDVFSRANGDERTDAATLVRAIDLLAQRGVRVANLSLAGPHNRVLAAMLREVEAKGMLVVAAAGNGGPAADPAWPAASDGVLAVTAVDAFGRIYRKAQRGEHLDVAAPGVEVWAAASIRGVRARTGTSYATPWATAAAALLMAQDPALTPVEAIQRMRALTSDAGEDGADPVFGQGVLSLQDLCQTVAATAAAAE
jgi:subtilisin family serine protease